MYAGFMDWKPLPRPSAALLSGRSVRLEPLHVTHAAALWQAVQGHDALWTWMADGPYATETAFTESIAAKAASPDAIFFAILPEETGQPAGYASWMRMEPAHGVVEVGNILLAPALQRTVAATEAMYLLARAIFELGYRRYEWKCDAANAPSRRAAERLGFHYEGTFRQHMMIKGRNRDTAWFSMLDSEWPARRAALEHWLSPENFDADGKQRTRL